MTSGDSGSGRALVDLRGSEVIGDDGTEETERESREERVLKEREEEEEEEHGWGWRWS